MAPQINLTNKVGQTSSPRSLRWWRASIPAAGMLLLLSAAALSYPRLSVEQSVPCRKCHINPGGAGMRTEFGNYSVALNELTLPQTRKLVVERYRSPRIAEGVTVGADVRQLIFEDGYIFRMQTDAFVALEPLKDMLYHFRFSETGISENYGILYLDKQKYYLKGGRFYPTFGLKNADHKSFNRDSTGHGSNVYLDGFAAGAEIAGFHVTAELFDVARQGIYGANIYRVGYLDPVGYMAGASMRLSEESGGDNGRFPHAKALFGGINYDRLTLMSELDLMGQANDTLIAYANATVRLEYGLYLIGEYNFIDSNRDLKDGTSEFLRFSVELYPLPFFELRPSYTFYTDGLLKDQNIFFVQAHFGY